ncbi:MAG: peptidoglycan-binding protein, partial [Clostridia bacterium]|nr:peptidoglycan-binding protein [Clostridia bacterium]
APVGRNEETYPGVPLRRGSAGEDVRIIKRQLNRIGQNYPAIPKINNQTEIFDAETEAAVRMFQQIFNLSADGIVGKSTWYKIKQLYNGVKNLSELSGEGLTLSEIERKYPKVLRLGDVGGGVRVLQYYLAFIGYFNPALPPIPITGTFDEATRDAVFAFQKNYGLKVDGLVGRNTWNRLQQVYNETVSGLPADYQRYLGEAYPGRFLTLGDSGPSVKLLQQNLQNIAKADPSVPSVTASGKFDAVTQEAVRAVQRQLGLEPNGAVGPVTWSEIVTRGSGYAT